MAKSPRILLIDDVPMFRDLGRVFLSRSGPVDLADSAEAAFASADAHTPGCVIADMHLPDLDGAELCRHFKANPRWGSPPVVLLARPDAPEDHANAVHAGADEVLFKPLEREVLIGTVRRLTDHDSPRGLPRALIDRPVEISVHGQQVQGVVRNVSRGGLFVDAPLSFTKAEEVTLRFSLEGRGTAVSSTAQVVWSESDREGKGHAGFRFLEIDALTAKKLDHYVNDHFPRTQSVPA